MAAIDKLCVSSALSIVCLLHVIFLILLRLMLHGVCRAQSKSGIKHDDNVT